MGWDGSHQIFYLDSRNDGGQSGGNDGGQNGGNDGGQNGDGRVDSQGIDKLDDNQGNHGFFLDQQDDRDCLNGKQDDCSRRFLGEQNRGGLGFGFIHGEQDGCHRRFHVKQNRRSLGFGFFRGKQVDLGFKFVQQLQDSLLHEFLLLGCCQCGQSADSQSQRRLRQSAGES